MLQEYVLNVSAISFLCCSKCFHVARVLSGCMFHTYVASVCSKCFIRFKWMLHSNISCCMCFILFGELTHAWSDGGTAWAPENGPWRARG